ncbi:hypothetical protein ACO0M4_33095 [Streptomyces sp. RGM 3693]|uniref:hypothetical protein n=1 Tax=Streptomyces sp. RGM 3693 TaxID=3413284 RepID=UPI003D2658B1
MTATAQSAAVTVRPVTEVTLKRAETMDDPPRLARPNLVPLVPLFPFVRAGARFERGQLVERPEPVAA